MIKKTTLIDKTKTFHYRLKGKPVCGGFPTAMDSNTRSDFQDWERPYEKFVACLKCKKMIETL